MHFRINCS